MKKLFPLGLLLLMGCERPAADPAYAPTAQSAATDAVIAAPSVDSYMRGYSKDEQCMWGNGSCAIGVSQVESVARTSGAASRVPRVRLTLRNSRLDVQFLTPYDPAVRAIVIRSGEEYFVSQPETEALGVHAIKVKQGNYRLDPKLGEYGGVHFNVQVY